MSPSDFVARQTELGLTNVQLAAALGISPITLSYWRNGRRPLPNGIEARLAAVAPSANAAPLLGRPKKQTFALPQDNGTYAFYFTEHGRPLSNEDKMAMPPGSIFWLARSPTSRYDGSVQEKHERSRIPGHRQNSHPLGVYRAAPIVTT